MRDKRIWLAGLLLLGAAMSVRADDADGKASQGNWFTRMFRKAPSKEAEPPKKAKPDPKASNANESGTPVLYSPGAQRALAQTVLMRREEGRSPESAGLGNLSAAGGHRAGNARQPDA
jgi:hypothetical protein